MPKVNPSKQITRYIVKAILSLLFMQCSYSCEGQIFIIFGAVEKDLGAGRIFEDNLIFPPLSTDTNPLTPNGISANVDQSFLLPPPFLIRDPPMALRKSTKKFYLPAPMGKKDKSIWNHELIADISFSHRP